MNRIAQNAGWIIGCKVVKAILSLAVTMITARYLGAANYGLINYAASIVAFVSPLMKLGLDGIAVHEVVTKPDKEGETMGSIITMSLVSSLFCILGVFSFAFIVNREEPVTIAVCTCYSIVLLFQAVEMLQYWFQAKLLSKYSALAMLISYIVVTVVQILLLVNHVGIIIFALSYSLDYLIIALVLLYVYYRLDSPRLQFSYKNSKNLFRISKYYIISGLMITVFNNTDRVMLKLLIDDSATGIYSAAHTCAGMTSFIFVAIIDSMRGTIFERKSISNASFEKSIIHLYSIIIYFSLIQCVAISLLAPIIIKLMFGQEYIASTDVLRIAIWFSTFSYLGTVRDIWILSEGKQSLLWKINLSGALMNVILNCFLIPSFGPIGAAIASVFSQFFTNVLVGFVIPNIRRNNVLLLKGVNPMQLITAMKMVKAK